MSLVADNREISTGPRRVDRPEETLRDPDALYRGCSAELMIFSRRYDSEQRKHLLCSLLKSLRDLAIGS
jgi:hypothetical protein